MLEPTGANGSVLPEPLRSRLLERARLIHVRRNQIVIAAGESDATVYLVVEGAMQASLMTARGREMTFRDIGPGMLFGEIAAIDGRVRSATVAATSDTVLAEVRATDFVDFLGNVPGAGLWLARELAAQLRRTTDDLFAMGMLSVAARIQCELLRLAQEGHREGDRAVIRGAPTHAAIAARIGSHREAVTRELRALSGIGVIEQRGRTLTVLSMEKLQNEVRRSTGEERG